MASAQSTTHRTVFDCDYYLNAHTDLRGAFGTNCSAAKNHWLAAGINERRRASPVFDCDTYLSLNGDVQAAYGNSCSQAINHWVGFGIAEHRQAAREFAVEFYKNQYADLAAAYCPGGACNYLGLVDHYMQAGSNEGRRAAPALANGTVPFGLQASVRKDSPGFTKYLYSFKLSPWAHETERLVGLSGSVNLQNLTTNFAEALVSVWYIRPANGGTCPASGSVWGDDWSQVDAAYPFGPEEVTFAGVAQPGRKPIANFILKAPTAGWYTNSFDFTLPAPIPLPHDTACLVVLLDGGPIWTTAAMAMGANITAKYVPGIAGVSNKATVGIGNEFCYGMTDGCMGASTDSTKSFYHRHLFTGAGRLLSLFGNYSDSTFDGLPGLTAVPLGLWEVRHDIYLLPAASCGSTSACGGLPDPSSPFNGKRNCNGTLIPGNYYEALPPNAIHLLTRVVQSTGKSVKQVAIHQTFGAGVVIAPGQCLVSLGKRNTNAQMPAHGGIDSELQVYSLIGPP